MNAQEKAKILREAGYIDVKTPSDYQWYWNDTVVSWTDDMQSRQHTTDAAYQHYLDNLPQAPLAPATDAPTIPQPLAEKDAEIARMRAALLAIGEHSTDRYVLHKVAVGLGTNEPAPPQLAPTPAQGVTKTYEYFAENDQENPIANFTGTHDDAKQFGINLSGTLGQNVLWDDNPADPYMTLLSAPYLKRKTQPETKSGGTAYEA